LGEGFKGAKIYSSVEKLGFGVRYLLFRAAGTPPCRIFFHSHVRGVFDPFIAVMIFRHQPQRIPVFLRQGDAVYLIGQKNFTGQEKLPHRLRSAINFRIKCRRVCMNDSG